MAKKKTRAKRATRKKVVRRKAPARKKVRRRTTSGLKSASTGALQAELKRREAKITQLEKKRDKLLAQAEALDKQISGMGGGGTKKKRVSKKKRTTKKAAARRGRPRKKVARKKVARKKVTRKRGPRPRNKENLVGALQKVLKGKTMSVSEVAVAVKKAGYKTKSANFRIIVNQALISNRKLFKKVARGQYTAT